MEKLEIDLKEGQKIYFASDFHLGTPNLADSRERERQINLWLDSIKQDAHTLFLLGDIFDFWFEYKKVVPKGFIRFMGKIAELADSGIQIIFFHGNHDMWMFDYFKHELNAIVYANPIQLIAGDRKMLVGHGDGLGPGDRGYKILRAIFRSELCQFLFRILPPQIGIGIAHRWSKSSRINSYSVDDSFVEEKEHLVHYCKDMEAREHHDCYIFGHRHLVLDVPIGETSRYVNLGEWVNDSGYAVFDTSLTLHRFEKVEGLKG